MDKMKSRHQNEWPFVLQVHMIFTFNSVNNSIGPAAASYNRKDKLNAISTNATWRDIGAATGTLAGGLLLRVRRSFGGIFNSYLYTCSLSYYKFENPNRH